MAATVAGVAYKKSLAYQIYRLQLRVVRELNDVHIFVQQATPLLVAAKERYESSGHKEDREYFVPAVRKDRKGADGSPKLYTKAAMRTDQELKELYDRFISRELMANLLVASVSKFESFLFGVLYVVMTKYPKKLSLSLKGVEAPKAVPLEVLLEATDLQTALDQVIRTRLHGVSYASPKEYLEFFSKTTGVPIDDEAFPRYVEVKATRDLLVHADGIVNDLYLAKADTHARGKAGVLIPIGIKYFEHALATMKRVAGVIKRETEKTFGNVAAT